VVDHAAFVFHASLRDNVRYGRPDASDEEITIALEQAGLGELTAALPKRLDTVLGEDGQQLSAGERQRVAIARTFLAEPTVLVLDEATATLDPIAEAHVLDRHGQPNRGRTTILITHRLEMAQRADKVVVIEDGRVVAQGRPDELLAEPGPFRSLFARELDSLSEPATPAEPSAEEHS
jgi:ABC-type multidrug transport system fused ATPase/permease subunit